MKYNSVYFDSENQKIRFTKSMPENISSSYVYIGKSTRVEFDLLIEFKFSNLKFNNSNKYQHKFFNNVSAPNNPNQRRAPQEQSQPRRQFYGHSGGRYFRYFS